MKAHFPSLQPNGNQPDCTSEMVASVPPVVYSLDKPDLFVSITKDRPKIKKKERKKYGHTLTHTHTTIHTKPRNKKEKEHIQGR